MKKLTAKVLCACMLMTSCPVYTNVAHADREEVIEQHEELDNVDVKTNKKKKLKLLKFHRDTLIFLKVPY